MFLPLELKLRPSRIQLAVLALGHGLALAGIWLAALPAWMQWSMTAALFAGALRLWRESSARPQGLRVTQSGQVEILERGWQPAELEGCPIVMPWLVSLVLAPEAGKTRRLILWSDSTEADLFRKLRVWLRWRKLPEARLTMPE
jgi:toxin CptA